jgi:histone-lysine N-methyltransferase SETMAR
MKQISGVSVQNFTQPGGHADFLRPLIWSRVSGLMRFLTADQKQQRVNVCEELRQIASDDVTFLFWVITGDESWIYGYDPETKQQSSQWRTPNSPRPKKARQVKSKVRSMLIIFFGIKGIVHKEFFLADQTANSAYYCDVVR